MVDCDDGDLVCLYLDGMPADASGDPAARTAAAIGDALEVGDTAAARVQVLSTLEGLQERGLLTSEQRAVEGHSDSHRVYSLTDEGRDRAAEVRERVLEESVVVTNGTSEEVPLAEIDRYFERRPLVTALVRLTDEGEVPLETHAREGFVDRETELETVVDAVQRSFVGGTRTVVVSGAPGMGKSTLVEEACREVRADEEDVVVARGGSSEGVIEPYAAIRQAFAALPGGEAVTERIDAVADEFEPDEPEAIDAQRAALFNDVADQLRSIASGRRVILVLEELQWADETTLALFAHLATTVDELVTPVAFVGTYQELPETAGEDHPLSETLDRIDAGGERTEVRLEPLSKVDTRALLATELGRQRLPEAFVDLVYERTGGNPLFVAETARHVRETARLDPDLEEYPTSPAEVSLPTEVTEQIERRLASLDEESRELLRLGAVLGERVPRRVLAAASDLPPVTHREYVDVLVSSGIWRTTGSGGRTTGEGQPTTAADGGDADLEFVSGSLREAVVDRLPENSAREYHGRIADAYLAVADGDPPAGRVAHHAERAGDAQTAVEYYRRAAAAAVETYAHQDAIAAYRRAVTLARGSAFEDDDLATLLGDLASVHERVGECDEARDTVEEALQLVGRDSSEYPRLLGILAAVQAEQADYEAARETARRQREAAAACYVPEFEAEALQLLGDVAFDQGEYEQARDRAREGLEIYREVEDRRGEATTLNTLGTVSYELGEYDRAREFHEESLAIASEVGDRRVAAAARKYLGNVAFLQGVYDRAREYYEESLSTYREVGDRLGEGNCLHNLGSLVYLQGEYDQAREYYEQTLAIDRETGDRHGQATTLIHLGNVAYRRGEYDVAREHYREGLDICLEIDDRRGESMARNSLGMVAARRGEYDRARECYEESLAIKRDIGDRKGVGDVLTNLGRVDQRRGEYDAAAGRHEEALELFREIGSSDGENVALINLGSVARDRREYEKAREYYEDAAEIADEMESPEREIQVEIGLGTLALDRGDPEEALEHLEEALRTGGEDDRFETAHARLERARVARARDRQEAARDHANRALAEFEAMGTTQFEARARLLLARLEADSGGVERARNQFEAALSSLESVDAFPDAMRGIRALVETCREADDPDGAREWCRRARELLAEAPDPVVENHEEWVERVEAELDA